MLPSAMKRFLSRASFALALLFGPVVAIAIMASEMTHLHWALPVVAFAWAGLFGLHHLAFGRSPFRRRALRVGLPVLALAILGAILSRLVRYEGSASGSSYPKFSWVWEKEAAAPTESVRFDAAAPAAAFAGEWPEFLGPGRAGMVPGPHFGTDWVASPPEPLWRRPVGKGWSSFAVAEGRAVTQEQRGDDEHVTCLELASGEELWSHADRGARLLLERAENAGAAMGGDGPRATPTLHGGRVFAMGATGIVNCLELETGRAVWSRHLLRSLGAGPHRWGMACSPLVLGEAGLVVFVGPEGRGPSLVACEVDTGETVWTSEGSGGSYASPRLLVLCGREQIVSVEQKEIRGVAPATGETLWSHPWPGEFPKVGQPLALPGDRLLATASYGAGSLLLQLVKGEDGAISAGELWKSNQLKTKFSSAAVIGEHAYGLDEGRLACIELASGARVWKREKFGFGQHLLFGDRLLVQAEPGEVVVGRLGPAGFEETGRLAAFSSMTWNAPAVAGRVLLVRNDREAAAYLLPEP
jgi:outer membrane protein assembly factor BamB